MEIRLQGKKPHTEIFSEVQFWQVIDRLDWSKKTAADILAPASAFLATLPIASIYLFADKLSDKNKEQANRLGVQWIELRTEDGYKRFKNVLQTLNVPHSELTEELTARLETILKEIYCE